MPILGIPKYIPSQIGLLAAQVGNQIDSSDGTGNSAPVYATRSSSAPGIPATNAPTLIVACYDAFGSERRLDFGGGAYGTPDINRIGFYTAAAYNENPDEGLQRLAIESNGRVHVGNALVSTGLFQVSSSAGISSVGLYVDVTASTHRIVQSLAVGSSTVPSFTLDVTGSARITEQFLISGDISPTALGGTSNNYNPTGFSTCSVVRQDVSSASILTGLAGGTDGRTVRIINITTTGANTLTLNNQDAGSTAGNRFILPGGVPLVIGAGSSVILWYDSTSARWRPL